MAAILAGYLFPHPPIIVEEIGKGHEKKAINTIEGAKALSRDIKLRRPSTVVVITPHGIMFKDKISISSVKELSGDFKEFGQERLNFNFKNNMDLVNRIVNKSINKGIPIIEIDEDFQNNYSVNLNLDHGTLVPLYFVTKEYRDFDLVHINYGLLSPEKLYEFGTIIKEAAIESHENVVIIASGDLSHRLSKDGPYAYSPLGRKFDRKIVDVLKRGDFKSIVRFDLNLSSEAGECGLRSLMILSGALDGYKIESKVLSYEGPYGVGYCTAKFLVLDEIGEKKEDEYVRLARESLEYYVKHKKIMDIPEGLSSELLNTKRGVFVSIKKDGMLRGCIGTIEPIRSNLAEEIIENAISAGTMDPRFPKVTEEELPYLVYSVDVLKEPEPISSIDELNPKKYGVIVSKGFRRGLLLPNIEGINTPMEQVEIALKKAGIMKDEKYKLERFEVVRHI